MAKPMGQANAYLVGFKDGPVKIGVTSRNPRKRFGSARRELKMDYWDAAEKGMDIYGTWPHRHAYMIEKLSHMYLREYHRTGEWFDVSIHKARRAVAKVIRLLDRGWKEKVIVGNWFARHGIPEFAVIECFGKSSFDVMAEWNYAVFEDWDRRRAERDASGETARRQVEQERIWEEHRKRWRNEEAALKRAERRKAKAA